MINKEKNFVSLIFYLRNAETYIEDFLNQILGVIDDNFVHYEIVCVNNASTDHSVNIVKNTIKKFKEEKIILNIIHLSECLSFEEAISIGIDFSIGDFIFEFDVPFIDYPNELIMDAYHKILSDIDIVSISPNKKITLFQKGYYALYNFGVNDRKKIRPERLRIISRRAINRVSEVNNYFTLSAPVYKNCGLDTYTISYMPAKTYVKYDNDEFRERFMKGIESILVYTNSLQKAFIYISFLFLLVSVSYVFFSKVYVSMFFFLISIILFISAIIFQYMSIILNSSYKKRIELIKSIEKVVN